MTDQFATYEMALKLKELGFKEKCFTSYDEEGKLISHYRLEIDEIKPLAKFKLLEELPDRPTYCINPLDSDYVAAPLYQQVLKWLRDKKIFIEIVTGENDNKENYFIGYVVSNHLEESSDEEVDIEFSTYEEALDDAILEALNQLEILYVKTDIDMKIAETMVDINSIDKTIAAAKLNNLISTLEDKSKEIPL